LVFFQNAMTSLMNCGRRRRRKWRTDRLWQPLGEAVSGARRCGFSG
jgi:hypothetical protein